MTAEEKFIVGQRVKVTEAGMRALGARFTAATRGTVTRFGMYGALVTIRRDGQKATGNYHPDFWEPEGTPGG